MFEHHVMPWFKSLSLPLVITLQLSAFPTHPAFADASAEPTQCSASDQNCVRDSLHSYAAANKQTLSYDGAREMMFQKVDSFTNDQGARVVKSVYSPEFFDVGIGIPRNGVNTEHTWPQTFLKKSGHFDEARADIYHLFPSEVQINGTRGSLPFRECGLDNATEGAVCPHGTGFEPPEQHKGVAARAMFYIAVMYGLSIDKEQEKTLREWSASHPVLKAEQQRAEKIKAVQGNRNPFIEHPEWVDLVQDF